MTIRIFVTGGTFDKEYNELNGELYFKDTHLPEMLKLGRCKLKLDLRTLMMIDSTNMTDSDREIILHNVNRIREDKILITHGTDTMAETARVLARGARDKTVVLTDGLFNLGAALAFVQTLPHGVYISMNGKYFNWDNVRKNRHTGEFEETK